MKHDALLWDAMVYQYDSRLRRRIKFCWSAGYRVVGTGSMNNHSRPTLKLGGASTLNESANVVEALKHSLAELVEVRAGVGLRADGNVDALLLDDVVDTVAIGHDIAEASPEGLRGDIARRQPNDDQLEKPGHGGRWTELRTCSA